MFWKYTNSITMNTVCVLTTFCSFQNIVTFQEIFLTFYEFKVAL